MKSFKSILARPDMPGHLFGSDTFFAAYNKYKPMEQEAAHHHKPHHHKQKQAYCNFELIIPGYAKEDFDIVIQGRTLYISVDARSKGSDREYLLRTYNFTSFTEAYSLPTDAVPELTYYYYKDGVLVVSMPRWSA